MLLLLLPEAMTASARIWEGVEGVDLERRSVSLPPLCTPSTVVDLAPSP